MLSSSPLSVNGPADLPTSPAYRLEPGQPSPGWPTLPRPPIGQTLIWWYRNINLFPIAYAFRPQLRVSTNPEQISFTQETLGFRRRGFSPLLSLLMSAFSLPNPPVVLTVHLQRDWNAPLPITCRNRRSRSFGGVLKPRYIFGAGLLDQ